MPGQYTTLVNVKAQLGIVDASEDALIGLAIDAASRSIDRWTGTEFNVSSTTARTFFVDDRGRAIVDRFNDSTGLLVKTGTDGTYPNTLAANQYVLEPTNAPARGLAYYSILSPQSNFTTVFPASYGFPTLQVTARWGYSSIPSDVELAARIKAARLFQRKDSPQGTAGINNYGDVVVSDVEDPDVAMLLLPYRDLGWA